LRCCLERERIIMFNLKVVRNGVLHLLFVHNSLALAAFVL